MLLFRPASRIEVRIGVRASIFESLLASLPNKLDGLELVAVRWGLDDLLTTIIDEIFDLGCKGLKATPSREFFKP
jgi:hypothetical protein